MADAAALLSTIVPQLRDPFVLGAALVTTSGLAAPYVVRRGRRRLRTAR